MLTRPVRIGFSLSQLVRNGKSVWLREDIFHMGILSLAFKKENEGQSIFPVLAVFLVPLTQNSQCAGAPYFGVACSELFQHV